MKKILLLAVVAVSLSLVSCSKDDDSKPELTGTEWVKDNETIIFYSQTECKSVHKDVFNIEIEYTYIYSHPNVVLTPEKDNVWASLSGVVSGKAMTLTNMSTNEDLGVYTKK